MIINLTPHNIDVYGPDAPDVIAPHMRTAPVRVIPAHPEGATARIVEHEVADFYLKSERLSAVLVEFGHVVGLPSRQHGTFYVVSLATALAMPGRDDLLVPWRQVRNPAGTVIGCRGLARPC